MKKLLFLLTFFAFAFIATPNVAFSQSKSKKTVSVRSYTKKDGTRVKSHKRSPKGSKRGASLFLKSDNYNNVVFINDRKNFKPAC